MNLDIRPAGPDDLETVVALIDEATEWLAAKGLDQWQPLPGRDAEYRQRVRDRLARSIERGECYLAYDDSEPVATLIVDEFADPEFWTPEDDRRSALYVHRMAVKRSVAGKDIGGVLLSWASRLAAERGKHWIRLDAWRKNLALHEYYKRHGFAHVRTMSFRHRGSGALFQRDVGGSQAVGPDE